MKQREQASDDLISKIIQECTPTATNICPFLMQDPLLEPRLREILSKIKVKNWKTQTTIYASMHNANIEEMKHIIDDGTLDNLMVSFYGSEFQPGLDNEKAARKLDEIIWYRNSMCRKKPIVTMQWIADLEGKERLNAWDGIADGIQVVPFDTFHGTITEPRNRTKGHNQERKPCARLWNSFNVHSNGNVVPCCIDYSEEIVLGNMNEQSALEIWNSDQFNELREMHMQKRFSEISLCRDCTVWEWL